MPYNWLSGIGCSKINGQRDRHPTSCHRCGLSSLAPYIYSQFQVASPGSNALADPAETQYTRDSSRLPAINAMYHWNCEPKRKESVGVMAARIQLGLKNSMRHRIISRSLNFALLTKCSMEQVILLAYQARIFQFCNILVPTRYICC